MRLRKFGVVLFLTLLLFVITSCGELEQSKEKNEVISTNTSGKIPVSYIQHGEKNQYQLGVFNPKNNKLYWIDTRYDFSRALFEVIQDFETTEAYLSFKQGEENRPEQYTLHLPVGQKIDSAPIKKQVGKFTQTVQQASLPATAEKETGVKSVEKEKQPTSQDKNTDNKAKTDSPKQNPAGKETKITNVEAGQTIIIRGKGTFLVE